MEYIFLTAILGAVYFPPKMPAVQIDTLDAVTGCKTYHKGTWLGFDEQYLLIVHLVRVRDRYFYLKRFGKIKG